MNNTKIGASSEGYAQRISCTRNFELLTGMVGLRSAFGDGRADAYEFLVVLPKPKGFGRNRFVEWTLVRPLPAKT